MTSTEETLTALKSYTPRELKDCFLLGVNVQLRFEQAIEWLNLSTRQHSTGLYDRSVDGILTDLKDKMQQIHHCGFHFDVYDGTETEYLSVEYLIGAAVERVGKEEFGAAARDLADARLHLSNALE